MMVVISHDDDGGDGNNGSDEGDDSDGVSGDCLATLGYMCRKSLYIPPLVSSSIEPVSGSLSLSNISL